MPIVSVIIPVYNAMPYLQEAVKSIIDQTFTDYELIFVDDGSTDTSLNFLKKLQIEDQRITVLHQINKGAGVARNYGMNKAKGKYLLFLDADDIFLPNLIFEAVKCAEKNNADITIYKFQSYHNITMRKENCDYAFRKEQWSGRIVNWHNNPQKIFTSFNPCAWNKLFKKSFIDSNGLRFQDNKRTNDLYFTTMAMALAERIALLDKVLLQYRIGNCNSSQATNSIAEFDFFKALMSVKESLEKNKLMLNLQKGFNELITDTIIHNIKVSKDNGVNIYNFMCKTGLKKLDVNISELPRLEDFFSRYYLLALKEQMRKVAATKAVLLNDSEINMGIKVSVIIPIYNVQKYLLTCLKSVSDQTLENIEIIAVNDGSSDNSLELLIEYGKKEKRLKILNQYNAGLSMARNNGVKVAKGEYLYFLDSDDFIEKNCLEKLYNKAIADDLEVVFFDADSFFEFNDVNLKKEFSRYNNYYKRRGNYLKTCSGMDLLIDMYKNDEYRASAVLQFIKRSFYLKNNLSFYPGLLYEDNLFTFKELTLAGKTAHIKEILFHRRIRENSIVTKKKTFYDVYSYYICWQEMLKIKSELQLKNRTSERIVNNLIYDIKKSYVNMFYDLSAHEKENILFLPDTERVYWNEITLKPNYVKKIIMYYREFGLKITVKKIINKIYSKIKGR